jgi:ATP-binding cassette subfamily A (ABC1) protein 3
LGLQNEIDRAFIKSLNSTANLPNLKLQAFPYPKITEDMFLTIAAATFPMLFVICMIMSVKNVIKNITIEIETSLKESMKMMGLSSSIHWFSWFTKCFIMMIIPFTINCILMTTNIISAIPMFAHSNALLIWILFVVYIVTVITFSFLMSVVFKKSSTAGNVGSLLFFIVILPYNYLGDNFHSFPYVLKALYCMLVNSNMGQALNFIMNAESLEQGVNFSTLFHRDVDLRFSFGEILFYMLVGSALMLLLTNYIERVFPGEFGIAEPFYYPLLPALNYLKKRMGYRELENEAILQERKVSNPDIEDEPENGKIGIKITNLSKKFGDKFAVNKLSLNMYEDQITVLLGHNGAGEKFLMILYLRKLKNIL